jgi:hypothetical protein
MTGSLLSELPKRTESILAGAIHAQAVSDPLVRQICSSLEAPSAVSVVLEAFPDVSISFREIPEPDPRVPWQPVPFVLWRYEATTAYPAVDEPPSLVKQFVADIAARPYTLARWSEVALDIARALAGIGSVQIAAAMVHPPPAPVTMALGDWRFRVQVATALLVTRVEEFGGTSSRAFLQHFLHGPVDWVTSAAIVAYLDIARRHPADAVSIAEELLHLAARPPSPIWFSCGAYPAMLAVTDIPGLDESVYASVRRTLSAWSAR